IGSDGTVYVGSDDNKLYAIDGKTGKRKWGFLTEGRVASPAIGSDGTIYVGSVDWYLYSIKPDGTGVAGESLASRRPKPTITKPNLSLKKGPALDTIIKNTKFGTVEEKMDAAELLSDLRTAASDGLHAVEPERQMFTLKALRIVMDKKDADFIIHLGLKAAGKPTPDTIEASPDAPGKKNALVQLGIYCTFGTANERAAGQRLLNAIGIAQTQGLNAVPADLQRTVIGWLEPLLGKKETARILGR
ncbi:MAG: PQQ-like beta-propeller repeat protein, partial [Planctomycetaceae bacterium]|nr:PQQ-like beta-propeller repeat protein [Planctomycetaceae bacterium]